MRLSMLSPTPPPLGQKVWGGVGIRQKQSQMPHHWGNTKGQILTLPLSTYGVTFKR